MVGNNFGTVRAIADRIAKGDFNLGRVCVTQKDCYFLLNYTNAAQYDGDFTEIEKACRGLVIRDDGRIMALPMPKFFNLGEPQCPSLPNESYEVWEKIDGSLAIFWHSAYGWHCNTRGSFDNVYVERAKEFWDSSGYGDLFSTHFTVMCEIVIENDENQRAAYKEPGLYLVAVRDNYSGKDISLLDLHCLDRTSHVSLLKTDIDTLICERERTDGVEGWVIRFASGFRVKIKTAWYLRVFRAIGSLTPKSIRVLMLELGDDWINEFPDDLRAEAAKIFAELQGSWRSQVQAIYQSYSKVAGIESRKAYAQVVLSQYPDIASWLFKLRDGRFDEQEVLTKMAI